MDATERVINDLNVAKLMLCNPQLTPEMCVKIGQAINGAIDLFTEQKTSGSWEFVCHNPSYSSFDGSPSKLYRCTNCGYTTGTTTKYCPMCGSKNQP